MEYRIAQSWRTPSGDRWHLCDPHRMEALINIDHRSDLSEIYEGCEVWFITHLYRDVMLLLQ
jgi:hypothetical protein